MPERLTIRVTSVAWLVLGLIFLAHVDASPARAGSSSSTSTVNINANVAGSGSVVVDQDMSFGEFAVGPLGGSVVVPTSGATTSTGDVVLLSGAFTPQPAVFRVSGTANDTYRFNLAATPITLSDGNGHTMQVNALTTTCDGAPCPNKPKTSATGQSIINAGGTLTVGGNQAPGTYTGTITITVIFG